MGAPVLYNESSRVVLGHWHSLSGVQLVYVIRTCGIGAHSILRQAEDSMQVVPETLSGKWMGLWKDLHSGIFKKKKKVRSCHWITHFYGHQKLQQKIKIKRRNKERRRSCCLNGNDKVAKINILNANRKVTKEEKKTTK